MHAPKPVFPPPAPAGFHRATLKALIDLGVQPSVKFEPRHELLMIFQLADHKKKDDAGHEAPAEISTTVTFSMGAKSTLRKWIQSWLGKTFESNEQAFSFDVTKLVGRAVYLQVIHKVSQDRTYANVTLLAPIPAGVERPSLLGAPVVYDPTLPDAEEVRRQLPEWIVKRLANQLQAPQRATSSAEPEAVTSDDDIPF